MVKVKVVSLVLVAMLFSACSMRYTEPEYYSELYTSSASGCEWTMITCYTGAKQPQNMIYQDNVCRYYVSFGGLSVARSYDAPLRNVVLTPAENCVFTRLTV